MRNSRRSSPRECLWTPLRSLAGTRFARKNLPHPNRARELAVPGQSRPSQTPDGTIVVELEGKPIPVQVNADHTITITDPNDGKKIEVQVEKGKKLLTLTKEGFRALALEFNLSTKDGRRLTARFEPNLALAGLDKSQILFVSQRTGNRDIFLMNLDGTGVKNLSKHPAVDEHPAWSADGQKIAFASDRDGAFNIYMMDADGANVKALTSGPGWRHEPSWSPDGKKVVFAEAISQAEAHDLIVLDVSAGTKQKLTNFKEGLDGTQPCWLPDGKRIAFNSHRNLKSSSLFVMDVDGSNVKEITNSTREGGRARRSPPSPLRSNRRHQAAIRALIAL